MPLSPTLRQSHRLSVRSVRPNDLEFLYQVYASTRQEELAQTGWDADHIAAFLRMQFNAQHYHYQTYYTAGEFNILLLGRKAIGRLYLYQIPGNLRIVDIALLPAWRGQGLGTVILKDLQGQAAAAHSKVSIHVEQFNPALALYRRLGFQHTADEGVYYRMEWQASNDPG